MNLSFAGCGFLGIYHVGVAVAFKKYAPHLLLEKIGGASAGALAATCLLCDMPLGELTSDFFRVVNEARSHKLKAFSPSFNIQNSLLEGLEKFLPPNAHELVNGKLHISLTRFWGRKNVIVSQFDSREELLQALLCACWIPVFSGYIPPKFRGVSYMDGAFSDNLPVLDENTITVSPFCGESDICPRDDSAQLFHLNIANTSVEVSMENMGRLRRILVPCLPEELSDMCQQGFDDALQFLNRNYLISCTRCLAVQSTFVVQETVHDPRKKHFDPKCKECVRHRREALDGNKMPETVLTVFQSYIENANIGLAKWIFSNRGWRLLETLSLPATVPADMICATLTNIVGDTMERRQLEMWVVSNYINQSQPVLPLHAHRHRYVDGDDHQLNDADANAAAIASLAAWLRRWSRLLATTPCIRERFWHVADFLIDQINALNSIVQSQRTQKMTANISCQLSLTECGKQKVKAMTHRSSKLDILINDNEIISTIDRQQQQQHSPTGSSSNSALAVVSPGSAASTASGPPEVSSTTPAMTADGGQSDDESADHSENSDSESAALQRSVVDGSGEPHHHHHHGDVDSFDHVLQTTSHHEAVYAYYYLDENHKVKVTEIFDMTDNEDPDLQTINERAINQQLQFDATEWDARPSSSSDHMYAESSFGHHDHIGHHASASARQLHHQQHQQQQQHHNHHQSTKRSRRHSAQHQQHHYQHGDAHQHAATAGGHQHQRFNASIDQLDIGHADEVLMMNSTTRYARPAAPAPPRRRRCSSDASGDYTPDSVHLVQTYLPASSHTDDTAFLDDYLGSDQVDFAAMPIGISSILPDNSSSSSNTCDVRHTKHHQKHHPQQQQHDEQMWSDVDDDDNHDDYEEDELLSSHNSSDPEVDQSIASAASSVGASSQISERASRALQRSSQLHMML